MRISIETQDTSCVVTNMDNGRTLTFPKTTPLGDVLRVLREVKYCYRCDEPTGWLAPDGRCGACTSYTPEEIRGEV